MLDTYEWTEHAKFKMKYYGLSEQRVKRVIRHPHRSEEGVLEGAVAVMQPASIRRDEKGKQIWSSEIWVMYILSSKKRSGIKNNELRITERGKTIRIITAWRYPGVSPLRDPIPEEIVLEISSLL